MKLRILTSFKKTLFFIGLGRRSDPWLVRRRTKDQMPIPRSRKLDQTSHLRKRFDHRRKELDPIRNNQQQPQQQVESFKDSTQRWQQDGKATEWREHRGDQKHPKTGFNGGGRGDQQRPFRASDQAKIEEKRQKSLDQTKEELKRSLLKDFYKGLVTEERKRPDRKKDSPTKIDYDDEILRHLGKPKWLCNVFYGSSKV